MESFTPSSISSASNGACANSEWIFSSEKLRRLLKLAVSSEQWTAVLLAVVSSEQLE